MAGSAPESNTSAPSGIDPLRDPDQFLEWVEDYLLPSPLGGGGHRAHQFTINGLTYPFVRHYNFAAVPDPPEARRYDMYAGLHLPLPGDLLFFFQADPRPPSSGVNSRRGIRGLYRVVGTPYRAPGPVTDGVSGVGYRLLDRCPNPNCNTFHSTFSGACPSCRGSYPVVNVQGKDYTTRVTASHLGIRPVVVFERSVSDERVYADMSDPGIVWVGRHDNAMGRGKGSSIRHLLPEEAVKLVRLLLSEPEQSIGAPGAQIQPGGPPLAHGNGQSIDLVPMGGGMVSREDELYYVITRQLLRPNSRLRRALNTHLPEGLTWDHLEYASSTFPWGYTGGTADFVFALRDEGGRRFILVLECKAASAHDEAVVQVMLYIERVFQALSLSVPEVAIPETTEILPIVIAKWARRPREGDTRLAIPNPYTLARTLLGAVDIEAQVRSPLFLEYVPLTPQGLQNLCPVWDFDFQPLAPDRYAPINWEPPLGAVSTTIETEWILGGSWAAARQEGGL